MQIINDGLPEIIYEYLKTQFYDTERAGDSFSATAMLRPVQEIILTRRHNDEIIVKASDLVWSILGSSTHAVLEKGFDGKYQQEERVFKIVEGIPVSGKFDLIKDNAINDFKVTTVYRVTFGYSEEDWIKQLSTYRWLMYPTRILSDEGKIIAILRDWNAKEVDNIGYPAFPMLEIKLKLMSYEDTEAMVTEKILDIKKALELKDEELPACTLEDRWYSFKERRCKKCDKYCQVKDFCCQIKRDWR